MAEPIPLPTAVALGITEEEYAEYREAFNFFDTDDDGLLANRDLIPVMRSIGVSPTEAEFHDMISVMDPEKTGSFDLHAFLPMMANKIPTNYSEEDLKEAFRVMDVDSNGLISVADLRSVITSLGDKLSDDDLEEMIREADIDGDGFVNFEEYCYIMGLNR